MLLMMTLNGIQTLSGLVQITGGADKTGTLRRDLEGGSDSQS